MKTQKKIVYSVLVALLFVTNVYGVPEGYDYAEDTPKLSDKVKFGVGLGRGIAQGSPIVVGSKVHLYSFIDFFGEYKINDEIGVRLSVQRTFSKGQEEVEDIVVDVDMTCLKIAPTLRVYMGTDKQFCLFFSPQVGYLSSAKMKYLDHDRKEKVLDFFVAEDLEKAIGQKGYKVNRWGKGIKFGWDYECKNGLVLGGIFTSEWQLANPNAEDKKNKSGDKSIDIPFLHGQQMFYIGYNFAKLLD
jgi:hypothetical protein